MSENYFQLSNLDMEASTFVAKIQTNHTPITLNNKSNMVNTNFRLHIANIIIKFDKILTQTLKIKNMKILNIFKKEVKNTVTNTTQKLDKNQLSTVIGGADTRNTAPEVWNQPTNK